MKGSSYWIRGRHYVDSQALANLSATSTYTIVPLGDGWRLLTPRGAIHCARMAGREPLPHQQGALYELRAPATVVAHCEHAWREGGPLPQRPDPRELACEAEKALRRLRRRL
jgi:hypothetical protein